MSDYIEFPVERYKGFQITKSDDGYSAKSGHQWIADNEITLSGARLAIDKWISDYEGERA